MQPAAKEKKKGFLINRFCLKACSMKTGVSNRICIIVSSAT